MFMNGEQEEDWPSARCPTRLQVLGNQVQVPRLLPQAQPVLLSYSQICAALFRTVPHGEVLPSPLVHRVLYSLSRNQTVRYKYPALSRLRERCPTGHYSRNGIYKSDEQRRSPREDGDQKLPDEYARASAAGGD
nr:hypothetical protein CFP56_11725 [Quercus suber]